MNYILTAATQYSASMRAIINYQLILEYLAYRYLDIFTKLISVLSIIQILVDIQFFLKDN